MSTYVTTLRVVLSIYIYKKKILKKKEEEEEEENYI
jgi:hypothetical protein